MVIAWSIPSSAPLNIIIVEYSKYITTLAFDFAKQENDQQSVWHAMQHLLSIMRPLAKKGLIEKYKKARLANYNAIIKLCTVRRIFIELWGTTYKDQTSTGTEALEAQASECRFP